MLVETFQAVQVIRGLLGFLTFPVDRGDLLGLVLLQNNNRCIDRRLQKKKQILQSLVLHHHHNQLDVLYDYC